jgi:hypothetical protein
MDKTCALNKLLKTPILGAYSGLSDKHLPMRAHGTAKSVKKHNEVNVSKVRLAQNA